MCCVVLPATHTVCYFTCVDVVTSTPRQRSVRPRGPAAPFTLRRVPQALAPPLPAEPAFGLT